MLSVVDCSSGFHRCSFVACEEAEGLAVLQAYVCHSDHQSSDESVDATAEAVAAAVLAHQTRMAEV